MDAEKLEQLPRYAIQALARRENIRGNLKSSEIIKQLIKRYPGGVPRGDIESVQKKTKKRKVVVKQESLRGGILGDARTSGSVATAGRASGTEASSVRGGMSTRRRGRGESLVPPAPQVKKQDASAQTESINVYNAVEASAAAPEEPAHVREDIAPAEDSLAAAHAAEASTSTTTKEGADGASQAQPSFLTEGVTRELLGEIYDYVKTDRVVAAKIEDMHKVAKGGARKLRRLQEGIQRLRILRRCMEKHFFEEMRNNPALMDGSHSWKTPEEVQEEEAIRQDQEDHTERNGEEIEEEGSSVYERTSSWLGPRVFPRSPDAEDDVTATEDEASPVRNSTAQGENSSVPTTPTRPYKRSREEDETDVEVGGKRVRQ